MQTNMMIRPARPLRHVWTAPGAQAAGLPGEDRAPAALGCPGCCSGHDPALDRRRADT